MPVVVMEVTEKSAHEKTDQLFIYTFASPNHEPRQIVANLTNVYEVGDRVAIALPGTHLPGVEIVPRKVFGIDSSGMALGPVDQALDTDVTQSFDADREPKPWTITATVTIDARYEEDARKLAEKALRKGHGKVIDCQES